MINAAPVSVVALATGLFAGQVAARNCSAGGLPIYRNTSYSARERAEDLLPRLTWVEKVGQMGGPRRLLGAGLSFNQASFDAMIATQNGILGYGNQLNDPAGVLALANEVRQQQMNSSLVPFITVTDSVNGPYTEGGTLFPPTLSIAATFNVPMYADVVAAIRDENMALGTRWVLSPELDVPKDPRYGRIGETYGEDPWMVGEFGSQYVKTNQELDENGYMKIACTIKHFVYGNPNDGINTASQYGGLNHIFNDQLPPFIKVINESSPAALMASYATVDRVPMSANTYMLNNVLRGMLGFKGIIMSDAGGISNLFTQSQVATSLDDAGLRALRAGLELELSPAPPAVFPALVNYTNEADVAELIDDAVLALLELKFTTGTFDEPLPTLENLRATFRAPAHLEVNRNISREAIVLLQNENNTLPLPKSTTKVAVIGPFADVIVAGTYAANNSTNRSFGNALLQSLQAEFGVSNVLYERGVDFVDITDSSGITPAVAAAQEAGLAVLSLGSLAVQGEDPLASKRTDGEFFSHPSLRFPGLQEQLLDAVLDAGVPTVLVITGGQAFVFDNSTLQRTGAIVHSLLGGEYTADAVVEILVGKTNPSGKLPISLPQYGAAIPVFYDYLQSDAEATWTFPALTRVVPMSFGFGLSYTNFTFGTPTASVVTASDGTLAVNVSIDITNSGAMDGKEVVQVYYRQQYSLIETPIKKLVGIQKVDLAAGAQQTVTLAVKMSDLGYYSDTNWVHESGTYNFMVGSSSRSQDLKTVSIQL